MTCSHCTGWFKHRYLEDREVAKLAYAVKHIDDSNGIYRWHSNWQMPEEDRRYLQNGILFASNGSGDLVSDRRSGSRTEWLDRASEYFDAVFQGSRAVQKIMEILEQLGGFPF